MSHVGSHENGAETGEGETPRLKQPKSQAQLIRQKKFSRRFGNVLIAGMLFATGGVMFGKGAFLYAKAQMAQVLLEKAWDDTLADASATAKPHLNKPWPWADMAPIAKVSAPRLGQESVVLSQASGEAMAFAPGWVTTSARPGGPGVSVIAAHRNTHFRFLKDVKTGDELVLTTANGRVHKYAVTGQQVVRWNQSGIDPHASGETLALVTCWPVEAMGKGPYRLVVYAEAVTDDPANGAVTAAR